MNANLIQIGIVDDHNLIREALKSWLSQFNNFKIKLEAASGKELFDSLYEDSQLDVLILDLIMPGLNGKECVQHLRERYPHIKVLVMSMRFEHQLINELLNLGIHGYLFKGSEISELPEAIKAASANRIYRNEILTEALYWRTMNPVQQDVAPNGIFFTEKQKKIFHLLWEEKSTQEIADEVFISVSAVDKIKQQLKEKTGARSTVGLLKYAIENKIIIPASQSSAYSYQGSFPDKDPSPSLWRGAAER